MANGVGHIIVGCISLFIGLLIGTIRLVYKYSPNIVIAMLTVLCIAIGGTILAAGIYYNGATSVESAWIMSTLFLIIIPAALSYYSIYEYCNNKNVAYKMFWFANILMLALHIAFVYNIKDTPNYKWWYNFIPYVTYILLIIITGSMFSENREKISKEILNKKIKLLKLKNALKRQAKQQTKPQEQMYTAPGLETTKSVEIETQLTKPETLDTQTLEAEIDMLETQLEEGELTKI